MVLDIKVMLPVKLHFVNVDFSYFTHIVVVVITLPDLMLMLIS